MAGTLVMRGSVWHVVLPDPADRTRQIWRSTGTGQRRVAEKVLLQWQIRLGVLEASGTTLRDPHLKALIDEWAQACVSGLKASSRHQYGCTANQFLSYFGAKAPARKVLTVSRVQSYVGSMTRAGRKPATVDAHLAVLSSLCRYAVETGALDLNPVAKVKRPTRTRPLPKAYSAEEVRAIIAASPKEHRDLIMFLFLAGVRRSEAAALTAGQCLPPRGLSTQAVARVTEITVDRRVWHNRTDTPKTGARRVTLGQQCGEMLARRNASLAPDALVFPAANGGYIDWQRWARDVWVPALRRAGVAQYGIHSGRATSVTAALQAGVPVSVVAKRHGMSSTTLLRHYACVLSAAERDAADASEQVLLGSAKVQKAVAWG